MKRNILFLTTDSRIGGTEKSIVPLLKGLDREKYGLFLSVLKGGGELSEVYARIGAVVHDACVSSNGFGAYWASLKEFVAHNDIHIVHSFLFHANMVARLLKHSRPDLVCINSHRTMERGKKWHLWLDRFTKRYVDHEIANAEAVRDFIHRKSGSALERMSTIYNGYTLGSLDYQKKERTGPLVIGCIGNFTRPKGQLKLIAELAAYVRSGDCKLIFVGEGPLRARAQTYVSQMNLSESIEFRDTTGSIESVYHLIDLLVIPSEWEGMPNVLFEALLQTIPVVARDVGGIREVLPFTRAVFLYANGDQLHRRLTHIRNEYGAITRALAGEKKRIAETFSVEKMVRAHQDVYVRLISDFQKRAATKK
jgi:glycosyltransferase involved in cell wall biosynthesis